MMLKTWQRPLADAGAPFQFAPEESTRFFEPHGWREREWRSIWEESLRLKRTMRLAWLWNFIGRFYPKRTREQFRRFSGVGLLERRTVCPSDGRTAIERPARLRRSSARICLVA